MKFIFNGVKMIQQETIIDKINSFSDSVVSKEMEIIFKPLGDFLISCLSDVGHWFISALPDIMGYSAMAAAVFIIISSMTGKGMMKPLGWLAGGLIIAVCILGGV